MHFAIAGAGDWTVEVKAKTLRVAEGKPASPTSVITVDAETLTGMVDGKVKGDMAFMAGKLKATNVRDLGKFGKVFDFKKINAATASSGPAAAGPAASAPKAGIDVAALLQRMPGQFLPEKAAGFTGRPLQGGWLEAALEIKDKQHRALGRGLPTCTLTTDGATSRGPGGHDRRTGRLSEGRSRSRTPPAG
jgi:hypothetical protein